jgi:phosphatidylserine/phosphatidylglycerophosphate/cardiolipin synthase-like enzyme
MNLIERFTKKERQVIDQSTIELPPILLPIKHEEMSIDSSQHKSVFASNLQDKVVELIESASQTLILSTFLLADERVELAIYEAAKRKVRVYILLACETRLGGDLPDDEFGKKCLSQHIAMLNKLSGLVHFASAPHFHAKAVIADSLHNSGEAKGLLLTANLTEEALKRNEELAVFLNQAQIIEMTKVFRWAIFESAEHHMTNKGDFASYKSPSNTPYPTGLADVFVTSSEETRIKKQALQLIQQADKELTVSSFGWQEEHILVEAICNRARAGVKVTIFSRQRPAAMPALLAMEKAGATVKCFKWLHAKAIVVDGEKAMIMSANFQTHGMDEGFELGVSLDGEQIVELQQCLDTFLAGKHKELQASMTLGQISGDFEAWENTQFKSYSTKEMSVIELAPIDAKCLSDMSEKPTLPNTNWRTNTCKKIEFTWAVKPPVVSDTKSEHYMSVNNKGGNPKKPKEVVQKVSYNPKVIKLTKKQLAITVNKESDLEPARKLKKDELPNALIVLKVS